jgi:RNA polymerase sigma-70 factor (TIGR02943 family)
MNPENRPYMHHPDFNLWVEKYSDALYSWALHKTSDQALAEDLVQDTFLAAHQAAGSFEGKSSAKTWLFSILNHKILDHYRSKSRKSMHFTSEQSGNRDTSLEGTFVEDGHWMVSERPQAWDTDDSHLLDSPDFQKILADCLGKLPDNWSSVMHLKFLDEKEGTKICQDLNISPSNFWQILHRAKLQLRKCLETNWFATN